LHGDASATGLLFDIVKYVGEVGLRVKWIAAAVGHTEIPGQKHQVVAVA